MEIGIVVDDNNNDNNNDKTIDNNIKQDKTIDNGIYEDTMMESFDDVKRPKNSLRKRFKNCWDTFLIMKFNAFINLITMFIFVGCYTATFLTVPDYSGKMSTSIIIVITVIFTMIFTKQFGYVIDVYKNKKINDPTWNLDHIRWNAFLLLFITFGSIVSICFFMIRTQSLEVYNDIISQFNLLQKVVFSFDIILYIILISFISYHLTIHINNVKRLTETNKEIDMV